MEIVLLFQMSQYLETREAFLVMDCASWHRSRVLLLLLFECYSIEVWIVNKIN